jgi:serralysin
MCLNSGRAGMERITRRGWLAATGAVAATAALGREAYAAFEPTHPDDMEPHQHACVDQPYVPFDADLATRLDSPVEGALALQEGKSGGFAAAAAPQSAVSQFAPLRAPARAAYQNRWDRADKILRVSFENGVPQLCDGVMDLAREWSKWANISFERVRPGEESQIRVRFNRGLGHWSHIGKDSTTEIRNGRPSMNFAFVSGSTVDLDKDYSKFVVLHEFGHALGCIHEHQHPESETRFRKSAAIYAYFRQSLGTQRNEDVEFNIYRRWSVYDLIKYSKYDPHSIMHYAFPAWLFEDQRERVQNFQLSYLDRAFAATVYPGRAGLDVEDMMKRGLAGERPGSAGPESKPIPSGEPTTLTIDGDTVQGFLAPGQVAKYRFTLAADQSSNRINIASQGGTQVVLQLYAASNLKDEITPNGLDADGKPLHGTPDYTNDVIKATLAAGTYEVHVQHASPRGGGGFGISAKTGNQLYPRLAKPNVLQK